MSWKDIKIAKKLYIGFGIVLILTAAVGFVGWNGLTTTAQMVVNADATNRMLKWTLQMRRHEKNFLIRKDEEYVQKIMKLLGDLREQCETTKATMKKQENRDQIDAVLAGADNYEEAFSRYRTLFDEQGKAEENMVASARSVVEICNELRASQ